MRFQTTLSRVTWALLGLSLAACGDEAAYTLRWRFADEPPGAFSARDCGVRGIESFVGTETEAGGSQRNFRVVCGMGEMRRTTPPGTWTVTLVGVDAAGRLPPAETLPNLRGVAGPFVLELDGPEPFVEVVVPARPQCEDGVDNNGDGLVDADDPGCAQAPKREGTGPQM